MLPEGLDVIVVALVGLIGAWLQARVRRVEADLVQVRNGLVAALKYAVELRDHIADGLPPPPPDPPADLAAALMLRAYERATGQPASKD